MGLPRDFLRSLLSFLHKLVRTVSPPLFPQLAPAGSPSSRQQVPPGAASNLLYEGLLLDATFGWSRASGQSEHLHERIFGAHADKTQKRDNTPPFQAITPQTQ